MVFKFCSTHFYPVMQHRIILQQKTINESQTSALSFTDEENNRALEWLSQALTFLTVRPKPISAVIPESSGISSGGWTGSQGCPFQIRLILKGSFCSSSLSVSVDFSDILTSHFMKWAMYKNIPYVKIF